VLPDAAKGAIERERDPIGGGAGIGPQTHQRQTLEQARDRVPFRPRQTLGLIGQHNDHMKFHVGNIRQAYDTEASHFQQASQGIGRPGDAPIQVDLIVGDEIEAAAEQTQRQIGLAGTGRADDQHTRAVAGGATGMDPDRAAHDVSSILRRCTPMTAESRWPPRLVRLPRLTRKMATANGEAGSVILDRSERKDDLTGANRFRTGRRFRVDLRFARSAGHLEDLDRRSEPGSGSNAIILTVMFRFGEVHCSVTKGKFLSMIASG
jgi:hypothetical protein